MSNIIQLKDDYLFVANLSKLIEIPLIPGLFKRTESPIRDYVTVFYPAKNNLFVLWNFNPITMEAGSLMGDENGSEVES